MLSSKLVKITVIVAGLVGSMAVALLILAELHLKYESATVVVTVDGHRVRIEERVAEFDGPQAQPYYTTTRSRLFHLNDDQYRKLMDLATSPAFNQLTGPYGAPGTERAYLYRLTTTQWGQTREILFRSNPSYEGAPVAFLLLEQELLGLATTSEVRQ